MHNAPTCDKLCSLFEAQCQTRAFLQPDAIPHGEVRLADRAIGYMRGQAEKVSLGACRAFMIRPAPEWFAWAAQAMEFTCTHYDLRLLTNETWGELWGYTDNSLVWGTLDTLDTVPQNSLLWHQLRAALCGIPSGQVDPDYHQREGHGGRCESAVEKKSAATHCPDGMPHLLTRKHGASNAYCTMCGAFSTVTPSRSRKEPSHAEKC